MSTPTPPPTRNRGFAFVPDPVRTGDPAPHPEHHLHIRLHLGRVVAELVVHQQFHRHEHVRALSEVQIQCRRSLPHRHAVHHARRDPMPFPGTQQPPAPVPQQILAGSARGLFSCCAGGDCPSCLERARTRVARRIHAALQVSRSVPGGGTCSCRSAGRPGLWAKGRRRGPAPLGGDGVVSEEPRPPEPAWHCTLWGACRGTGVAIAGW